MTLSTWLTFVTASAFFSACPGPDTLFVLSTGMTQGRRAAILTGLGMCSGVSVHTLAVALGLAAVVKSSPMLFDLIRYAGAAYLLYLALHTLGSHGPTNRPAESSRGSGWRRGFLMNVLNPKVAMFFLAFLPSFADPSQASVPWQLMLLGLVFMLQAIVIFTLLGYFSGMLGQWLLKRPAWACASRWITAALFLLLAGNLLWTAQT